MMLAGKGISLGQIKGWTRMKLSPNFVDETAGRVWSRASFQFTADGTERTGVLYVTAPLHGDVMFSARQAAKKAAKRAGCDVADVTLHRIGAPQR